ncbi:MAG: class I SAM-dependent methyltransferase [Chloroflexota bacterium]
MSNKNAIDWFDGEAVSTEQAERLAALYDLDVPHGPSPAIDWFRAIARRTGGPILELGVGTGRVAIPLAQDGHDVVGLDRSEAMLLRAERHARREGMSVRLVEGDMRSFSFSEAFALIAIPSNTFLMLAPEDRWACLARVREHLAPTGLLAVDCFQPDPALIVGQDGGVREEWTRHDDESGREVTKFSSSRANVDQVDLRWWFEELDDEGRVTRWQRTTTLHYLYRREAELLYSTAGFDIEALHGDYDGSPAGGSSPKLLVVARRRERGAGRERRG